MIPVKTRTNIFLDAIFERMISDLSEKEQNFFRGLKKVIDKLSQFVANLVTFLIIGNICVMIKERIGFENTLIMLIVGLTLAIVKKKD